MAVSKAEILDAIAGMTVLELSEMIKEMETKFGVSAAAAAVAAARRRRSRRSTRWASCFRAPSITSGTARRAATADVPTAVTRSCTADRNASIASRTAGAMARSPIRRSARCGTRTSSTIMLRRPSMRSTAGSTSVADQRGTTRGIGVPIPSATAPTWAK